MRAFPWFIVSPPSYWPGNRLCFIRAGAPPGHHAFWEYKMIYVKNTLLDGVSRKDKAGHTALVIGGSRITTQNCLVLIVSKQF